MRSIGVVLAAFLAAACERAPAHEPPEFHLYERDASLTRDDDGRFFALRSSGEIVTFDRIWRPVGTIPTSALAGLTRPGANLVIRADESHLAVRNGTFHLGLGQGVLVGSVAAGWRPASLPPTTGGDPRVVDLALLSAGGFVVVREDWATPATPETQIVRCDAPDACVALASLDGLGLSYLQVDRVKTDASGGVWALVSGEQPGTDIDPLPRKVRRVVRLATGAWEVVPFIPSIVDFDVAGDGAVHAMLVETSPPTAGPVFSFGVWTPGSTATTFPVDVAGRFAAIGAYQANILDAGGAAFGILFKVEGDRRWLGTLGLSGEPGLATVTVDSAGDRRAVIEPVVETPGRVQDLFQAADRLWLAMDGSIVAYFAAPRTDGSR
jgi:hypothetical protein